MWFIPKNKKAIFSLTAGLCLSLGFMTGCKESAPPAKPAVVKKRIEQTTQQTTAAEKMAPAAETTAPKATEESPVTSEPAVPKTEKPASSLSETSSTQGVEAAQKQEAATAPQPETAHPETAAVQETQTEEIDSGEKAAAETGSLKSSLLDNTFPKYDPTGKIDPFVALFSQESDSELSESGEPKRPLTPLEKIDISQLKLVAIIQARSGNRATVQDGTGKPYILTAGTYIGIKSGIVTKILKDRVVVEEKTKDFLGRENIYTRELKLQKPFGEE